MFGLFKAPKYYPVEIVIPTNSTNTSFVFPNQPSLNGKIIAALEIYPLAVMSKSPLTQTDTVSDITIPKLTLEFYVGGNQQAYRIPAARLNSNVNGSAALTGFNLFTVDNWLLTWDKCNLFATQPLTAPETGKCLTIGVYYYDNI